MSYEDNYDQTARWDAESVREAEVRTQHRATRSSAERQKLKRKGKRRRFALWLAFVLIVSAILAGVGWLLADDMCSFNKDPVETTIEITRDDNLSTIANKLRLLRLTADEREVIMKYNLTERHARALLRLAAPAERLAVLERVVKQNLNVEKTEAAVEEVIGKKKVQNSYKKRSKVFQNVRIFVNTITKAVETMQAVGIAAESQKIQHEDYIEYRVKIPTTTAAAAGRH